MLELKNISKTYKQFALQNINIKVNAGDYYVLLGNSGSGKSLLLELIIGLIKADTGSIHLNQKEITNLPIQKRELGIVFQDFALFPHKTVRENILFALAEIKATKKMSASILLDMARVMDIGHLLDRYPGTLSGGEAQRVALARTLVKKPKVLLLDEPLSSLDVQLRSDLRSLLKMINQKGQTIVHVTHDYEEAVALAQRVAVIDKGRIIQQGNLKEVFQNPKSKFVADFVGIRNFFKAHLYHENGKSFAKINGKQKIHLLSSDNEGEGYAMIRDEDILLYDEQPVSSAMNNFKGVITDAVPARLGMELSVKTEFADFWVLITRDTFLRMDLQQGKAVWISFKASAVKFLRV
ncbi:MAG: ABC transporter ATP-binding protein [Bacteroidales bacterium]|nr:ABC transporter ATP-binding protein [Bacteroidales bacterium]